MLSTNAFSKSGKGNVTLSKKAMETFLDYLYGGAKNLNASTGGSTNNKGQKTKPLLFTLSETGDSYQYNYCSFSTCREPNKYKAILGCQKYSKGTPCFTFATKKKIVWKNDQNPKGLKLRKELKHGRNHVAQLVKDAGYYNGDITLLRGYQTETLTPSKSFSNTTTTTPKSTKSSATYINTNTGKLFKVEKKVAMTTANTDGYKKPLSPAKSTPMLIFKKAKNKCLKSKNGSENNCEIYSSMNPEGVIKKYEISKKESKKITKKKSYGKMIKTLKA